MSDWLVLLIMTFGIGFAIFIGALMATLEHIHNRWLETEFRHSVIAFGGGILLSAVSFVLVHEGMKNLSPFFVAFWFLFGGIVFTIIDHLLVKRKEHIAQFAAMLLDLDSSSRLSLYF